jgi:pimeloyl-ACP methyl ester carboxylesterase
MPHLTLQGNATHVLEMSPAAGAATGSATGAPIIMLHGLFTSMSVYAFTIAPKLARSRRVVLYDLRGHGNSAPCERNFTLNDLADDLLALKKALGIDRCHLVGYSFGGSLALYVAARHPETVESLALIEAPLFSEEDFAGQRAKGFSEAAVNEGLAQYTASTHIPIPPARAARIREQCRRLFEVGDVTTALGQLKAQLATLPLEQCRLPTLLLYGSRSKYFEDGRNLARRLPHSKLRVARADHNLPVTRHSWVTRRLQKFLW